MKSIFLKTSCAVMWGMGLLLTSGASAFQLNESNWRYQANPMESEWHICTIGMPEGAPARTKDGALAWNYPKFAFHFGTDSCLGTFGNQDGINQIDLGGAQRRGIGGNAKMGGCSRSE